MKRTVILPVLACVLSAGLCGCGGQKGAAQEKAAEEKAQVVADAFEDGDERAINEIIFGFSDLEADDGLSEVWGEEAPSQEGPLAYIFGLTTVKVKGVSDRAIEYEVSAPDMSGVFESLDSDDLEMSEDELLGYIRDYASSASTKTTTVSLEYTLVDGEVVVNYQDEEFINAITGGLLGAYQDIYSKMLEEYAKDVSE